jgi:hypothetical protein
MNPYKARANSVVQDVPLLLFAPPLKLRQHMVALPNIRRMLRKAVAVEECDATKAYSVVAAGIKKNKIVFDLVTLSKSISIK